MAILFIASTFPLLAQCKYEVDEVDPISNQRTLRTKPTRIHNGIKVKDGISAGFLDMKLAKDAKGVTLELHAHIKNPQGRMLMLRIPNDSLTIKFNDGTIISLPNLVLPDQYMNAFNGKPMISFTYAVTDELTAKFRSGDAVEVLRINMSEHKWDFLGFMVDPAQLFRDCMGKE